jgi:uncharacterized membrane protein YdbT with pleckstrin-like domain
MQKPNFLEGETVLFESKPLPQLKYFYVGSTLLFFLFFFGIFLIPVSIGIFAEIGIAGVGFLMLLMTFIFIIALVISEASYKQRYYWITNRRIIYRRGTFGYTMSSLPLERVSDVILSRTFWENLFGFGSLQIQTLAGQITPAAGGAEGYLQAIPEPEKVQEIILKAMRQVKN